MTDMLRRILRRDPADTAYDALAVSLTGRATRHPEVWAVVSFALEAGAMRIERIPHVIEGLELRDLRRLTDDLRTRPGVRTVRLERAATGVAASTLGL